MIGFIKKAIGMSGLFRSPKRANELIDEQIFATMKSIGGMFKEDGVMKEIDKERLKLQVEQDEFLKKYEKGEIDEDLAASIADRLTQKYKDLGLKIDELKDIRENIKSYDSISKAKEIEFHKELKKHQERTYQEVLKGY
ncbi:hypothetical protein NG754_08815 [Aliarcobacter cryaerophilus]|uniref:hypothetical protein n=1 Tax=Aliarcobacter cryaerophilus TaxID=28198 RepID=UPI003DA5F8D5